MISFLFFSCVAQEEIIDDENTKDIISCSNTGISISELDNIVFDDPTHPVLWKGSYNKNQVTISFTVDIGNYNETETLSFIFDKIDNCLKLNRAYKFYDGKLVDISAVTELNISEFYIKDWNKDTLFSGLIVYQDPHDKKTYNRKFWVDDFEDKTNFVEEAVFFEDCYKDKFPIEVDINNDNIIDFSLTYEEQFDIGNSPKFRIYTLKLIPASNKNKILSPIKSSSPYLIVFETPFSSKNTRQYFGGVKNALDVFYEFETPYESYNYFLSNNLTYKSQLQNDIPNYFLIQKIIDEKEYYGWIKFDLNTENCTAELLSTYLSPTPNNHIEVN